MQSFSKNEYTKFYKATIVSGDITGDAARQDEVRKALEAGDKPGSSPVVTLYEDNSDIWNVGSGNCTAVALAYDSTSTAISLYMKRFTCDPDGRYKNYYVTLGLSDGLSIYWGGNSIALGFIDGVIRMTPSPYSDAAISSYQFLLFTSEKATGDSYAKQSIGSKSYSNLCLEPFDI